MKNKFLRSQISRLVRRARYHNRLAVFDKDPRQAPDAAARDFGARDALMGTARHLKDVMDGIVKC